MFVSFWKLLILECFGSFLLRGKKFQWKGWYWQKLFCPMYQHVYSSTRGYRSPKHLSSVEQNIFPRFLGLSRRKHMVEGVCNLSEEKATDPENNSKMCTGLQQLNLKAAEKLLGCYEQKVWFQSIILVIHYVLCKRLWGLGLISIISLHCK